MSGGPPFDLGEFLLRACHDLRSPLRGIRTSAELLSRDAVVGQASDARQRLSFIVDGAGRMERLLDGLANYSILSGPFWPSTRRRLAPTRPR